VALALAVYVATLRVTGVDLTELLGRRKRT
jgi:hypothetical protein